MTREEEIKQAANACFDDIECCFSFTTGAEWADDNPPQDVVNLNKVWHTASEEPIYGRDIIAVDFDGYALSGAFKQLENNKGVFYNYFCLCDWSVVTKWAYISDIL